MPSASAADVAQYMKDRLESIKFLYQKSVVYQIRRDFGEDFVYKNKNGNLAIREEVLDEFNNLTAADVVWSRSKRYWRKRREGDDPNSRSVR